MTVSNVLRTSLRPVILSLRPARVGAVEAGMKRLVIVSAAKDPCDTTIPKHEADPSLALRKSRGIFTTSELRTYLRSGGA